MDEISPPLNDQEIINIYKNDVEYIKPIICQPNNFNDKEIEFITPKNITIINPMENTINLQSPGLELSVDINNGLTIDEKYRLIVKKVREKTIIYEYMCYKTYNYYNKRNKIILMPSIFISSILTLINTDIFQPKDQVDYTYNGVSIIKIVNVIFNGLLTFMIALQNLMKYSDKADYFLNLKKKFTKLHNTINNEMFNQLNNQNLEHDTILSLMKEYDYIDESINYEFPRSIIIETKNKFRNFNLPTICNGIDIEIGDTNFFKNIFSPNKKKNKKIYSIV